MSEPTSRVLREVRAELVATECGHEPIEGTGGATECVCGWPTRADFDARDPGTWIPDYNIHLLDALIDAAERAEEVFPAGVYYVGDPCYVGLPEADRRAEGEALFGGAYRTDIDNWDHRAVVDGLVGRFGSACTMYGDGGYSYTVGEGATVLRGTDDLSVDSGTIGAVPYNHKTRAKIDAQMRLGALIRFDAPFTLTYNKDTGDIGLGPVTVHTGGEDD